MDSVTGDSFTLRGELQIERELRAALDIAVSFIVSSHHDQILVWLEHESRISK